MFCCFIIAADGQMESQNDGWTESDAERWVPLLKTITLEVCWFYQRILGEKNIGRMNYKLSMNGEDNLHTAYRKMKIVTNSANDLIE